MHGETQDMLLPILEWLCVHRDPQCVNSLLEQGADSCFILSMPGGSSGKEELWEGQSGTCVSPRGLLKAPRGLINSLSRSTSLCILEEIGFVDVYGILPGKCTTCVNPLKAS